MTKKWGGSEARKPRRLKSGGLKPSSLIEVYAYVLDSVAHMHHVDKFELDAVAFFYQCSSVSVGLTWIKLRNRLLSWYHFFVKL